MRVAAMRIRKHSRSIVALVIGGGILAAALWPEPIEVSIVPVARGPMAVTLDEDGETRVRERFVVSAPVAGRLQRVQLEPGDAVRAGDSVVARIASAPAALLDSRTESELTAALAAARAAAGMAQAERMRASAALGRARSARQRTRELAMAGAVAVDTLDQAETDLTAAEEAVRAADFAVARADQEVRIARARLQQPAAAGATVTVTAPVSGVVLRVLRKSESVVPVGEPLLEIGDPAALEVVADVLSSDAVRIRPGAAVRFEQWGGHQPLDGRVRRVEPSGFMKVSALGVEEQRVNVVIDFVDAAAAAYALGDGYSVGVRIVIWQTDDTVRVPAGAVFRRGEGWGVFVVDEGKARLQTLRIGERNATDVQIVEGLAVGQRVLLHPPDTITDGTRITSRPER
jgi:HlyD family secretion protein